MQDLPVVTLGDIIISLDTATRQAQERQQVEGPQYTLHDEVRVLLVHGILHLLGYDHEIGPQAAHTMAQQEVAIMQQLGWKGMGLIDAVGSDESDEASGSTTTRVHGVSSSSSREAAMDAHDVKLVCLDMDGTLLNSASQISHLTTQILKECLALEGVTVMLATGKARPAALSACSAAGLTGAAFDDQSVICMHGDTPVRDRCAGRLCSRHLRTPPVSPAVHGMCLTSPGMLHVMDFHGC